jgi:tRNA dimethylallyltransferase
MSLSGDSVGSRLRVIIGPTAAGKSSLALRLANAHHGAILSADSRLVYRGFDIGTAKPSAVEQALVPHWGIDVAAPTDRWSAARFSEHATGWLSSIEDASRTPVVVGGTGFWIAALVAPLAPMPVLPEPARTALSAQLDAMDHATVQRWCAALDPEIATLGHAQWRRAIEVALLSGTRLSQWQRAAPPVPPRPVRYLVVDPGPALEHRIADRVDAMLAAGWVDEVRRLMATVPGDAPAWRGCGYERLRAAVEDDALTPTVRDAIVIETRQYARRQRTWCRRQLTHGPVTRLDPEAPDAWARACAWWNEETVE